MKVQPRLYFPVFIAVIALALIFGFGHVNAQAQHGINLTWSAVTMNTSGTADTISQYNIYRATVAGGPYTKIGSSSGLSYLDPNGTAGQKFYYVVTAVDSSGTESAYSTEASASFLAVPAAPEGLAAASK